MRLAHSPRIWFLTALAALVASFGWNAFHAEEDPNDQFVYDRTESVLHLSLDAPGGTGLSPNEPATAIGVLLERYSWQIWRQPSTGLEEYRDPGSEPESGATVTLTRNPEMGTLGDSTLTTGSDGRAWTTFSPDGATNNVTIDASSGDSAASLSFIITSTPGLEEIWYFSHTEATLVAEITSALSTQNVVAGDIRDLSLSVRYETWDVMTSNFGHTRTENYTSAPAEGASVAWSLESGDGTVSGYGTTDSGGSAQGSFTMGSGESIIRAEIAYATGQATSATLSFSPQPPTGGSGGSAWTQIGSETIPTIVNLSADGSTELASGETRQISGQVQGEVWDIWTDGILEDRRYNYTTSLSWMPLFADIPIGDGSIGSPNLTSDGSGWFSTSYTMGAGPAQVALRFEPLANPAATIDFTPANSSGGDPGTGSGSNVDWVYLHTEGYYSIQDLSIDGPTYDLAPGEVRTIGGTLVWVQWEVWGNSSGSTEPRAGNASPVEWTTVNAAISTGDGSLSSTGLTTGSLGEFSTGFTMGSENSTVALSVDGPQGTFTTVGFTRSAPPEQWTPVRTESSIVVTVSTDPGSGSLSPGQSVPLRAHVTATTWEIRQSDTTGQLREFDHQTGPAIGATVDFALLLGPGMLVSSQAVTNSDGLAEVNFVLGESASTIRAGATFQTASSTGEMVVSPEIWVHDSNHEDLDLSLAVIGSPATGIEATVLHRTWQTWRNTTSGATEVRHQSLAPAANAEVVFARLDGGNPVFGSSPVFTNVSGFAMTTYQSDAAMNLSVTAGFAGLTTNATLAVPQGWGGIGGGGTGGGGTGGGGTGGGGTGGGGTGGGGTGGGGTGGGGTNPNPNPITFTLRGQGLMYRGASAGNGGIDLLDVDPYEYDTAESDAEKAAMAMLGWENYASDPATSEREFVIHYMRRPISVNGGGGSTKIENEDENKDDFRAILVGEVHNPEKRITIEGEAKVKERYDNTTPYTAVPTFDPDPWDQQKRQGADPEKAIYNYAHAARGGGENSPPDIYPSGTFKTHVWLNADAPVKQETKQTYLAILKEQQASSSESPSEPTTSVLGVVVFTIAPGGHVSTEAAFEGASSQWVSATSADPGCVQLTAPTPGGGGWSAVSLLPVEVVELSPKVKDEEGNEIDGSEKPNQGEPLPPFVEEDPHANRIAHRELKVRIGEVLKGKEVTWTLEPLFIPHFDPNGPNLPPVFRGEWEDSPVAAHRNAFEASSVYGANGFEIEAGQGEGTVAKTTVADDGFTAIRINVPPIGFNQARIIIQIEGTGAPIDLIDMEVPAVIVIDPGHGTGPHFNDSNVIGGEADDSGELEHAFALDLAQRARTEIRDHEEAQRRNIRVFLTRENTTNISAAARTKVARDNGCDVYMSIHFNDSTSRQHRDPFGMWDSTGNLNLEEDRALAIRLRQAVQAAITEVEPTESRDTNRSNYDSEHWESVLQKGLDTCSDLQGGSPYNGNVPGYTPCRAALIEIEWMSHSAADALFNTNPLREQMRAATAERLAGACIQDVMVQPVAD